MIEEVPRLIFGDFTFKFHDDEVSHKYNMLNHIVSCRNVSQLKAF